MKYLSFVSALLPILVFSQTGTTITQVDVTRTIMADTTKDALYEASMVWMAYTFTSSKSVIQYEDKAAGRIVGKAYMDVLTVYNYTGRRSCLTGGTGLYSPTTSINLETHFVIDITAKDGSVTIRVAGLEYEQPKDVYVYEMDDPTFVQNFEIKINQLIDDLAKSLPIRE